MIFLLFKKGNLGQQWDSISNHRRKRLRKANGKEDHNKPNCELDKEINNNVISVNLQREFFL